MEACHLSPRLNQLRRVCYGAIHHGWHGPDPNRDRFAFPFFPQLVQRRASLSGDTLAVVCCVAIHFCFWDVGYSWSCNSITPGCRQGACNACADNACAVIFHFSQLQNETLVVFCLAFMAFFPAQFPPCDVYNNHDKCGGGSIGPTNPHHFSSESSAWQTFGSMLFPSSSSPPPFPIWPSAISGPAQYSSC